MGAKFAPSVAGLFMAKWEEETVFLEHPENLVMYKRYIDNIFIIWKGDRCSLSLFFEELNNNEKNISLTWQIEEENIPFLDLVISRKNDKFSTKTFFKSVDRNSYLPTTSCHHKNWLYNIPKGQILRRNCTDLEEFQVQAKMMGERFIQKGYEDMFIQEKVEEVTKISRN